MGAKRNIIRNKVRFAQKQGKSINPQYLASCYGKVRRSKEDARQHAELLGLKAYRCKFCPYYHAGHKREN